ncbi:unnamed protein product [Boreogadus saida]
MSINRSRELGFIPPVAPGLICHKCGEQLGIGASHRGYGKPAARKQACALEEEEKMKGTNQGPCGGSSGPWEEEGGEVIVFQALLVKASAAPDGDSRPCGVRIHKPPQQESNGCICFLSRC